MRRVAALAAHDAVLLLREPAALITLLITPALLMLFLKPLYRSVLVQAGDAGATGAELAVPGMTTMFAFFMVGMVAEAIFREHGWRTWDRLRVSPVRDWELLLGKVLPGYLTVLVLFTILLALGWALVGFRVRGSVAGVVLILLALGAVVVSFGMALCALCTSRRQAFTYERLMALVWVGLGGTLVPIELLPGWLAVPARLTPTYWAMEGFRDVVLEGRGVGSVLPEVAALGAFAAVFAVVAVSRFRMETARVHW
jgi:ABC-2 type transport system permease protein